MDFKMKKDDVYRGMMAVAKNARKKVLIRKNSSVFFIVEFPYNERMSEIMGEACYEVKGEVVDEYPIWGYSFKHLIENYNLFED